jgi:transposase-like protein
VGQLDEARRVNLQSLMDDTKCYETVRALRWPEGVHCPHCASSPVTQPGRDTTQAARQKYRCTACERYFDDLTGSVFAGQHQPLRVWMLCVDLMGLNLAHRQIAQALGLNPSDVQPMTEPWRTGGGGRSTRAKLVRGARVRRGGCRGRP